MSLQKARYPTIPPGTDHPSTVWLRPAGRSGSNEKVPGAAPLRDLLSPSEKAFYGLADLALPAFKRWGMTPNRITLLSFLLGLLSSFCLIEGMLFLFVIFLYASYWLDCADGQFARRYGPYTAFGDKLDHYTDWVSFSVLIFVFLSKYHMSMNFFYYSSWIIFLFLFVIHFVCISKLDGNKYIFHSICKLFPIDDRNKLSMIVKHLRHMDTAMLIHGIAFSVVVFEIGSTG